MSQTSSHSDDDMHEVFMRRQRHEWAQTNHRASSMPTGGYIVDGVNEEGYTVAMAKLPAEADAGAMAEKLAVSCWKMAQMEQVVATQVYLAIPLYPYPESGTFQMVASGEDDPYLGIFPAEEE